MKLDNKEIDHLAILSNLEFTEDEKNKFKGELIKIVEFVESIQNIEVSEDTKLIKHISVDKLREDVAKQGLTQEEVLSNAPEKQKGAFKVPKVVG